MPENKFPIGWFGIISSNQDGDILVTMEYMKLQDNVQICEMAGRNQSEFSIIVQESLV